MPDTGAIAARSNRMMRFALGSILVGLAVLALKFLAWYVTGSVALYSDALESLVNIATAVAALLAIRFSLKPPDKEHPYGHHKIEYLSAVLEGVLIVVAALLILREAVLRFQMPLPIDAPLQGILISAVATGINALWSFALIRQGRASRSPALTADGRHLLADVVTSVGAVVGIAIAVLTGWFVLDPVIAILVAVNVIWSGWHVIRGSLGGLMDEAASPEDQERIRRLIAENAEGALEAHDLRTRHSGPATFIDFHLIVPGDMRVSEAHTICDRIEVALKHALGQAVISIHVEPEEKAKQSGILL